MKACLQVGIGSSLQEWRPGGEAGEADGALAFSCATCSFEEGPQDGVGRGGEGKGTGGAGIQPSAHQDCAGTGLQLPWEGVPFLVHKKATHGQFWLWKHILKLDIQRLETNLKYSC